MKTVGYIPEEEKQGQSGKPKDGADKTDPKDKGETKGGKSADGQ